MTKIIIVRHCEAEGNVKRIFQGKWDGKITENGTLQLSRLSEKMQDYPFDFIYSSPLSRAVATARACNAHCHLPIHILGDLQEIGGGDWEGKKWSSFPIDFPEESKMWNLSPHLFCAPNGESMQQLYERISRAITMIAKRHSGKTICVASHGCSIRNFLCFAKGLDITSLNDVDWCDNTAISVVDFDDNFVPKVIIENDCQHVDSNLSTFGKQQWWKKEKRENMEFDD